MNWETLQLLIGPVMVLVLWFLFGMYSMTAENHGRLIAFLMPLMPFFYLLVVIFFGLARLFIYPLFLMAGKKQSYERLIEYIKNPYLWRYNFKQSASDKDKNKDKR